MHARIPALAFALAALPFAASAAPQILALISTSAPKALACADGECFVEASAFCMEPARAGPDHRSTYLAAPDADIRLVGRAADGREVRVAAGPLARFHSQRGYGAVRVSVPEGLKAELGVTELALEVGASAALTPQARAQHRRPHKPEEIAAALGANRALGATLVDRNADGARAMSLAINALPEQAREDAAQREATAALLEKAPAAAVGDGRRAAQKALSICMIEVAKDDRFTLRECLQHAHDRAMWELNRRYWLAVGPTG